MRPKTELSFYEFSTMNAARSVSKDGFGMPLDQWSLNDWIVAALGELGEAANIAKKIRRLEGLNTNLSTPYIEDAAERERAVLSDLLKEEIADCFTYLDLLCQSQGFFLIDEVIEKFETVSERIGYEEDTGVPKS